MRFLLAQGIGDSVWALHKIKSVRNALDSGGKIDVYLSGGPGQVEVRALDFVRRFSFVNSAEMRPYSVHPATPISPEGYYNYLPDGWYEFPTENGWKVERVCALMPNGPLERGVRLEQWLPQYAIDWTIFKDFRIADEERAYGALLRESLGPYAVFYLGPLIGNTQSGHNRGPLWRPQDWIDLGRRIHAEFNLSIVVVGAEYDSHYMNGMVLPRLDGHSSYWKNLIGKTNIGQLYSITSLAKFVVSYQSGVGIVSAYLGTPTAMWWRPRGDSISPSVYLSFEERMNQAWAPPRVLETGSYFPMIYKRDTVDTIMDEVRKRGWITGAR